MGLGGRIALFLVKWLVVPAGLAVAGYYFLGPTIGRSPAIYKFISGTALGRKLEQSASDAPKPQATAEPKRPTLAEPDVQVSVTRTSELRRPRSSSTRRRHKHTKSAAPMDAGDSKAAGDPASSGGIEGGDQMPPSDQSGPDAG